MLKSRDGNVGEVPLAEPIGHFNLGFHGAQHVR
jgi:hypothetical protein